jgi:predicted glycosyltransferase
MERTARPRIALFTHDAYGLGHIRRSVRILRAVAERAPDAVLLLITGSPAVDALKSLPPGADYLKLPTIVTSGNEGTRPPVLDIGVAELASLRGALTRQALESFDPEVFLVDNFPLGTRLELLPALKKMRARPTRTVLGLRDVVDPPRKVRADWERDGLYEIVDRYYDRVLIYGVREILDAADAYALPAGIAAKVHYCGYVTAEAPPAEDRADVLAELGARERLLVATAGGGGDGYPVLRAFLEALPLIGDASALVVTGEFMTDSHRAELRSLAAEQPGVTLREHVGDLPRYLAAADVVVAMGGYNTSAEILATKTRAVLVPRTWRAGEHLERARAKVDAEQLHRAEALARLGAVAVIHPDELTPERLAERVRRALSEPRNGRGAGIDVDGAGRVAEHLLELAGVAA